MGREDAMVRWPQRIGIASLLATTCVALVFSQAHGSERELDAHQHGHGSLNIAIEGSIMWIELETPGADIVGFEHPARSDAHKAAIEEARARLSDPVGLFGIPSQASCALETVTVSPVGYDLGMGDDHHADEDAHDDHDDEDAHDDHADEDAHDDHADEEAHDNHADEDAHDDHADEDAHDDHADEGAHDDHADEEETSHAEFHAEYTLQCADPAAITSLTFTYFDVFPGAEELQVTVITEEGQSGHEVTRDSPVMRLGED